MSRYSPLQLADAFIRSGELADALDVLNAHLATNPTDADTLRLRAAVLMRLPGQDHSRAALHDLQQIATPSAEDYVQQSIIWQIGLADWSQAVTAAEHARLLAPHDERIAERLFMLYEQIGSLDQAWALLSAQPRHWRWLQQTGDLAQKIGDDAAAYNNYTEALADLDAKLDTAHNGITRNIKGMILANRAAVLMKQARFEAAEQDYRAAADHLPTDLSYSLMAAAALALSGQTERAANLVRSVLADAPQLAAVLREQAVAFPQLAPLLEHLGL